MEGQTPETQVNSNEVLLRTNYTDYLHSYNYVPCGKKNKRNSSFPFQLWHLR